MTRILGLLIAALCFSGCLKPLELCQFEDLAGEIADCSFTDLYCFEDRDGDGIASRYDVGDCTEPLTLGPWGDCDDTDDNNFPGNPEVCDGFDNDCIGDADFDEEEGETEPGSLPACAPGAEVALFLRGGGVLGSNMTPVDGSVNSVVVGDGGVLGGVLKLRAIFDPSANTELAAVLTASWVPLDASEEGVPIEIWDPVGGVLPQPDTSPFDFEIVIPEALLAPAGQGEGPFYLTVAATSASGAPHLAALSSPNYCCEGPECMGGPGMGAPCEPVLAEDVVFFEDQDLHRLTELDLGGCATFGAARVSFLEEAFGPGGMTRCTIGEPECLPVYRPKAIGCRLISLTVEGDEG